MRFRLRALTGSLAVLFVTAAEAVPVAPANLTAVAVSPNQINLTWTDQSSDETGFYIERGTGFLWVQIATVGANVTTFQNTGLIAATSYSYRVRATNATGNSGYSNTATAITPTAANSTSPPVTDSTAPTTPTGLAAAAVSSSQINLTWAAASDSGGSGLAGYKVYRSGAQIATTTANNYSDTGRSPSTLYCYTVAASDNAGNNSAQSSQACATTPAAPVVADTTRPTVSITSPSSGTTYTGSQTATITASASDNVGVSRVEFYDGTTLMASDTAAPYTYAWTVTSGTHSWTARAYDAAGNSATSTIVTLTVSLPTADTTAPVTGLLAPANGSTISNTVALTATASDNVGVARVVFYMDASIALGTITSAPYSLTFDTRTIGDGSHTFFTRAYDAAGNSSTSTNSIVVTVRNTVTVSSTLNLVGFIPEVGFSHQVVATSPYAYVAADVWGLTVVDTSTPSAPRVVGSADKPFDGSYLAIAGTRAYVTGQRQYLNGNTMVNVYGLYIFDISTPNKPKLLGSLESSATGFNGVAVAGNYAYVAAGASGLVVINISNPAAPTIVGTGYNTPGWANNVTIAGNYAYVADGSMGLRILNISNPLAPTLTGTVDTPGSAYAVALSGSYAYVADSTTLQVINVSNPAAPTIVGSAPVGAADVEVAGTVVYCCASSTGLVMVNVSNPAKPTIMATLAPTGAANPSSQGVSLLGAFAYVANGAGGLAVASVSNPSSPATSGSVMSWFTGQRVSAKAGYAVVAGAQYFNGGTALSNSVRVLNVSIPASVTVAGALNSATLTFGGLAVAGNYAYVACGSSGLKVIDLSNPAAPDLAGAGLSLSGWANAVTVAGNYAYVASGAMGLRIVNISNPLAPTLTGTVDTPGNALAVAVSGNYAYVADSSSMQIINVSNPAAPTIVGSAPVGASDVEAAGTTVYCAASSTGVVVVNCANPSKPVIQATIAPSGASNASSQGLALLGTMLYVANGSGGVAVIDVSNPAAPAWRSSILTVGDARDVFCLNGAVYAGDSFSTLDVFLP